MNHHVSTPADGATPYRCSSCARCFVAFGAVVAGEILCPCGSPLLFCPLPRGLYELPSTVSVDARVTDPRQTPIPKEPDLGYGASHGYDAAHGGPTGPGDAPADVPERVVSDR